LPERLSKQAGWVDEIFAQNAVTRRWSNAVGDDGPETKD
jgi:hypothetical protein